MAIEEHGEQQGCLDIWIDEIVPCLKETATGDLKETVVFKIQSRSYLKDFNTKNGWHINWSKIPKDVEVYALAIRGSNEIQGLIGVKNDPNAKAAYIHWACTAPQNNKHDFGTQKYEGVGGHLVAIAVEKSLEWGYEGVVYGYALNMELVSHYVEKFNAELVRALHPYHVVIGAEDAMKLLEVYTYEWN